MPTHHTPGPWHWQGYALVPQHHDPDVSNVHTILEAEFLASGFVASKHADTTAESAANLALIAAAPDLYDALRLAEEFIAGFEDDDMQDGISIKLAIIRAAMARAGTVSEEVPA